MFKVGDEVVIMIGNSPLDFNKGEHPARGKILKIGRKLYSVECLYGSPIKVSIDGSCGWRAMSVADAKVLYRKSFAGHKDPIFAERCIESL